MEGFDFVRKLRALGAVIDKEAFESLDERDWFVQACAELKLQVNAGKSLV